jgi:hypothetical protein
MTVRSTIIRTALLCLATGCVLAIACPAWAQQDVPCKTIDQMGEGSKPSDIRKAQQARRRPQGGNFVAVVQVNRAWENGQKVVVQFTDPGADAQLAARLITYIREWESHVNLRFEIMAPGADPQNFGVARGDIRVSFLHSGYYSAVGTGSRDGHDHSMNLHIDRNTPEMNVRRVVLHEFGHALCFQHEHQNPAGGIHWIQPDATNYFMQQNGWTEEQIQHNIFEKLAGPGLLNTHFDRMSIMVYTIPQGLAENGFWVPWNTQLSQTDKNVAEAVYPPYGDPIGQATVRRAPGSAQPDGVMVLAVASNSRYKRLRKLGDTAFNSWLNPGAVITEINGIEINNLTSYRNALEAASRITPERLLLKVTDGRGNERSFEWRN